MGLAEVLADSRAKATNLEVEKLIARCPPVPVDGELQDKTIYTRDQKPDLGTMVCRSFGFLFIVVFLVLTLSM